VSSTIRARLIWQEYESIGILGAATNTMDAEGAVITTGNFDGITREDVEAALQKFQGQITQTPPM
jgi:tRNA pseudouridine55 synthase